jgi:hypothetical protein
VGGPWRDRGFDAKAWRPPVARVAPRSEAARVSSAHDYLTGIVIAYIASVLTSIAIMLTFLKHGW